MIDPNEKFQSMMNEMLREVAVDEEEFTRACIMGDANQAIYLFNKVQLDKLKLMADIVQDADLKVDFQVEVAACAVKLENLYHEFNAVE